ncbi:MAG TPA: ABC transporter ATP-binding protein [Chloroflexota bacterium]|nr:ABC transporter ATP-binding protein [Chloroflexota bacterium]
MPQEATTAVALRGVRKVFGRRVAVEGLDLRVPSGTVFGLLGPNGAGKTTCIKMMLGLVRPTAGSVELLGLPSSDTKARARVGFLPEQFRFHEWLTAAEFLDLHGRLYGMSPKARRERIPDVLERVGLSQRAGSQLRTFSKGMLQRIGLAQAIMNDPKLLILDEPTSGLDPVGRREVRDLIVELRAQGVTVLLNSHILSDIERVCDLVAILDLGRLVWSGRPDDLGSDRIVVTGEVDQVSSAGLEAARKLAPDLDARDGRMTFTVADRDAVSQVVWALVTHGVRLYELRQQRRSLEDLFVNIVEGRDA